MGTDIHLAVQRRNGDRWERVERWVPNPFYADYPEDETPEIIEELYTFRNYLLFAVLAGVRNTYVFSDGPVVPIAEGRGLPADFKAEMVGLEHGTTEMGFHSFTWMTLAEIEAYDFNREIVRTGWLNGPARAVHLDRRWDTPELWWRIPSKGARILTQEELDAEIANGIVDPNACALWTWTVSLSSACAEFVRLLPALRALAPSSKDVRLVMGFDS